MRLAGDFLTCLCRVQRHFILCLSYNVKQVKPILHIQNENKLKNRTISKKVLSFRNGYNTATIFRNLQMNSLTIRGHRIFERHYHLWGRICFLYNKPSNPLHRSRGNLIHNLDLRKCWAALCNESMSHQHTIEQWLHVHVMFIAQIEWLKLYKRSVLKLLLGSAGRAISKYQRSNDQK